MIFVGAAMALVCRPGGASAHPVLDSSRGAHAAADINSLLPTDYSILNERSIFLKGQLIAGAGLPVGPGTPSVPPGSITQQLHLAALEESLVFDGVTKADDQIIAFIENRTTSAMSMVKIGDSIALGRVTAIDLDGMNYTVRGRVVHVQVGENLLGNRASIADTSSAASTTTPAADSAGPGTSGR